MAFDRELADGGQSGQDPRYVSQLTRNTFAVILAGGRLDCQMNSQSSQRKT